MLSDRFKKLLKFAWFLPGFLLWAAYPPMGERMDVLFALAPLMWLSRRETDAKVVAKRWFQSGIFFWVATLSWMPAIVKNGGPWPLVVLGWFALAAYCALYFWLYGWLSATFWCWARGVVNTETQRHRGRYWLRLLGVLLVEPVLWCGLELVRSRFLGGFSWNQLGVVPINSGFGAPAALGGVYLCSAVVILINGTFAGIAERVWKPEESGFQNLKKLGPLETVLAFGVVWGVFGIAGTAGTAGTAETAGTAGEGERSLKVAMVQRNFPCCFKAQEENPVKVYDRLLDNVAMLKPDLVVLSESAMCEFGPVDQQGALRFAEWVQKKTGAALLAGGTRFAEGNTYNSATLYSQSPIFNCQSPDQQGPVSNLQSSTINLQPSTSGIQPSTFNLQLSTYDKAHLVPFGEFIPGDKLIPALQKLAPVGSCTPGEVKLLDFTPVTDQATEHPVQSNNQKIKQSNNQTIPLGVAICFEDTDSAQMRELARQGAKALFFITNDSWFSHSIEAEQHAWQAVARAIETGLPVVRVGNSGVTGTIAPDGKTTWLQGPNGRPLVDRAGTMFDRILISAGARPQTPYVFWGDCPLAIAFALLIAGLIVVKYKNNL